MESNATKIQLVNDTWWYFYGDHCTDLQCGPKSQPPVTRSRVREVCKSRIKEFTEECNRADLYRLKPTYHL
jgi:hypothetical protein